MPSTEAMRLFVRVLDEEAPGWWRAVGAVGSSGVIGREEEGQGGGDGKERKDDGDGEEEEEDEDVGRWVSLSTTPDSSSTSTSSTSSSSGTPCPRYEHAAALLGRALFVVGGSRAGGRMLSDSWALDLETLRWSDLFQSSSGSLPPRAGLCLFPWKRPGSSKAACLLAVGGHAPKSGRGGPPPTEMEVWRLEPGSFGGAGSRRWTLVPTGVAEGSAPPPPRGGHSVTVIPGTSRAFVFGERVFGFEEREGGERERGRNDDGKKKLTFLLFLSTRKQRHQRQAARSTATAGAPRATSSSSASTRGPGEARSASEAEATERTPPAPLLPPPLARDTSLRPSAAFSSSLAALTATGSLAMFACWMWILWSG